MNLKELNNAILALRVQLEKDKKKLIAQYCAANNKVQVGDIFTDHLGSILVDTIQVHYSWPPQYCFSGLELTKKLQPRANRARRSAYQRNGVEK
jgi:hypothetical protein